MDAFRSYLASQPSWPDTDGLHPMEATHDRITVIEFAHEGQTLEAAIGYGRNLPPRHSPQAASASAAIAQVLRVLPEACAAAVASDASELLEALRQHTGWRQYIVRLELVREEPDFLLPDFLPEVLAVGSAASGLQCQCYRPSLPEGS